MNGHAVLDALRPELFNAHSSKPRLPRILGDMSALLPLSRYFLRQILFTETSGKINRASRLSRLAEQLCSHSVNTRCSRSDCCRNATFFLL